MKYKAADHAMHKPCDNCPFTKSCLKGWLGRERAVEIYQSGSFVCHKTTFSSSFKLRQCAGHILMKGIDSEFVQAAKFWGDDLEIEGRDRVFDSEADFINHHE